MFHGDMFAFEECKSAAEKQLKKLIDESLTEVIENEILNNDGE